MPTVQAKLFEWHRVDTDAKAVRVLLRDAIVNGDPKEINRLLAMNEALESRARELLSEIDRDRSGGCG